MNIPRRIAALKREIQYRRSGIERLAELRAAKEPSILAFPDFIDKVLVDIKEGIAARQAEILRLESSNLSAAGLPDYWLRTPAFL